MRQDTQRALVFRAQRLDAQRDFATAAFGVGVPAPVKGKRDRLAANQSLTKNQAITSANGRYRFVLQADGNAVVYDGAHPLWATGTNGKPIAQCVLQNDGNLVLYEGNRRADWASNTAGKAHPVLVMQDDNNLVLYSHQTPVWSSRGASQHGPFDDIAHFVSTAVNAAGREIGKGLSTVAGGLHDLQKAISNIPVIGGALATLYDLGSAPFTTQAYVADACAKGEPLDKALKANLDRLGKEVSDVLPWVASIISIFPVFGPLVSTIIMTAAALVAGQPIEEVLITAALSAIPGMAVLAHFAAPIIMFGIKIAKAVASHAVDFGNLIVDGLQMIADLFSIHIPDMLKEAIKIGVHMAAALARGMKLADALLHEAIELLQKYGPELLGKAYHELGLDKIIDTIGSTIVSEAEKIASHIKLAGALTNIHFPNVPGPINDILRKIFGGSICMGAAAHIQKTLAPKVQGIVNTLADKGKTLVLSAAQKGLDAASAAIQHAPAQIAGMAKDLVLHEARKILPPDAQKGFDVGVGLLQHTVNPFQLITVRDSLDAPGKKGFDVASALHIGRVSTQPPPPPGPSPTFATHMASFGPTTADLMKFTWNVPNLASMPAIVLPGHKAPTPVVPAMVAPKVGASDAGFFLTAGMSSLPADAKTSIMATIADVPEMRAGAVHAVEQVAVARTADPLATSVVHESAWHRLLAFFGWHPHQTAVPVHTATA